MNSDLLLTLGLLLACVILFIINKPRMDAVALMVVILLPLAGIITLDEALAGFSDPNVILIGGLFVIGEGLVRTGIAYRVGGFLVDRANGNETKLLIMLMLSVSILGSVMSSTGVVAIFVPVVLSLATRLGVHAGRFMMPLCFAGLISGMMTLVGTPPNLVLDGALKQSGFKGFGFFSFTPIGAVVLLLGIGYMLIARRWMTTGHDKAPVEQRWRISHLIESYNLTDRGYSLRILPRSPLAGKSLSDLEFRTTYRANVIGIARRNRFYREVLAPRANVLLKEGDVLLMDMMDPEVEVEDLSRQLQTELLSLNGRYFSEQSNEVGMAEVLLPPDSDLLRKTVRETGFRKRYGLNVVGIRRNDEPIQDFLNEKLSAGDTLLVVGTWSSIRQLQTRRRDFLVLTLPAEIDAAAPAAKRWPLALLALAVMITLMVSGIVPNLLAVLISCMLMGAFKCVDMTSAYKSIHWQSLVVIVGMMPFALALQKTGGIDWAAETLTRSLNDVSPRILLASLFILTALTGIFISNTATAVLMAPLAISVAHQVGAAPQPFAMIIALAASAAFMAPISSPVNMLVMGPGKYRFIDFLRIGIPFTILVMVMSVLLVPMLFPF